jgi:amino acid transporter
MCTVPKAELLKSKEISAALFFRHALGSSGAVKGLNFLIALSSFGNLIAVLLGQSRLIRECGRQGVLPFPRFWASTRPFGTPLGPYAVKWFLTTIMIIAPPAGDAFNFSEYFHHPISSALTNESQSSIYKSILMHSSS